MSQHEKPLVEAMDEGGSYLIEQFDSPKTMEVNGRPVEYVDVSPTELKTEAVTLMLPGFSANAEALKDAILNTAKAGRRVVSPYAAHGVPTDKERPDMAYAEMKKLELLLQLIEVVGAKRLNIIANSEAAIYATVAGLLDSRIENIVYVEPAGLVGEGNMWELVKGGVRTAKSEARVNKDELPEGVKPVEYPAPMSILKKTILPHLREAWQEMDAIAHADITPALAELHAKGVGVSIMHAVDDETFPMEKMQDMAKAHMIDGFYSVWGGHNNIQNYKSIGIAVEEMLSVLENKKKKQADEWAKSVVEQIAVHESKEGGGV